jgi:hypothetical protein
MGSGECEVANNITVYILYLHGIYLMVIILDVLVACKGHTMCI